MLNNNNRPGMTDEQARGCYTRLAAPAMNTTHQSAFSTFSVILPSGKCAVLCIPLAAAVAIEEAGYSINLVGRLNG